MAFDLLLTNGVVATMDGDKPFGLMADGAVKTFTPSVDEAVLGRFTDRHAPPENK